MIHGKDPFLRVARGLERQQPRICTQEKRGLCDDARPKPCDAGVMMMLPLLGVETSVRELHDINVSNDWGTRNRGLCRSTVPGH